MDAQPSQLRHHASAIEWGRSLWGWSLEERLLREVNSERSCSANTSTECWLIDDLDSWNRALLPARLVLTEFAPGKLCLRSFGDFGATLEKGGNGNDGAYLVAWLPRQHLCIHEVRVHDWFHVERLSLVASFIGGRAPNLQRVVVRTRCRQASECGLLDAFGPPQCLRDLELTNVHIGDSLAHKVAEVLRANAANLATVKLVGNHLSPESAATLLLALADCCRLVELSLQDSVVSSACDDMAEVFRSTQLIRKVTLFELCEAASTCKHWAFQGHANCRHACLHCVTDLFDSLGGNFSLQHLTLQSTTIGRTFGQALAYFLTRNHSLETLALEHCSIDGEGAAHIAEALVTNCTLASLSLVDSFLEYGVVATLCRALQCNATLKTLLLPNVLGAEENHVLLEALRREPRAQFPLSVSLPASVSPLVADVLSCAAHVLVNHFGCGRNGLQSVYTTLASNQALHTLAIQYVSRSATLGHGLEHEVPDVAELDEAVCSALKSSQSLRHFHLEVYGGHGDNEDSVMLSRIFEALASITCLRQVSLRVPQLDHASAQRLEILVSQCRGSLVELNISTSGAIPEICMNVLKDLLARNPFLSKMTIRSSAWDDNAQAGAIINYAVESNVGLLNKATRFVLSVSSGAAATTVERCWASAFDELCGTASLLEHIDRVSGKPQLEVLLDVKKAQRFLQENFFILAGVVCSSVTCGLGDGSTQLDALNVDCLRSIARYLKISDVRSS